MLLTRLPIQRFTLLALLTAALIAMLLWSGSLYLIQVRHQSALDDAFRAAVEARVDSLRSEQKRRLQRHYERIRRWMLAHPDAFERLAYINRNYLRYPWLRLIQLQTTDGMEPFDALGDCVPPSDDRLQGDWPWYFVCQRDGEARLGLIGPLYAPRRLPRLIILADYHDFVPELGRLLGRHLQPDETDAGGQWFIESGLPASERHRALRFEWKKDGMVLGGLLLRRPGEAPLDLWLSQAWWMLPALLLLALGVYILLRQALLAPLLRITLRLRQEVMAHRPAHDREDRYLAPGLRLLHKYFTYLTHISRHDPLTGLSNRVIFEERLHQAIVEGKRSGRKYALVFIDIDHFHRVNHELGPYFGDGVLKQLGRRLTEMLRESDSVARLEKDNFALLLPFDEDDRLSALVEKIYQNLCKPYRVYGREVEISVSIGVAVYPNDAQDMDELALKADQALMLAQKGDWPVVFLEREGSDFSAFSIIQSLRQALDDEEFELVYQPVLSLPGHRTGYFEALLRWKHPEQHQYSIERTIELAEKNHLIKPLTHWILNCAVAQLAELEEQDLRIAINLSMVDLHEEDLPDRVRDTLDRHGVSPRRLLIEITEGQIMQEPEQVIDILGRLARMGISLSIDDFGTGQASLTYLKKMPVEKLKIDQSFVRHLDEDADDCYIVEATIQLAHTLGLDVVAEGVETAEIHNLLLEMGCDFAQGWYISRPMDAEHMIEWYCNTRPGD